MSTRDSLIEYLRTVLDDTAGLERIHLVKTPRNVDKLSRPTLVVKTDSLEKLPAAPIGNMLGNFTLGLVSNHLDMEKAEDQLDELLEILLPALFTHNIVWTQATQTAFDEQHLSYDIAVSTIIK